MNVELLHCCISLYSTQVVDNSLSDLKITLDGLVEKMVHHLGLLQDLKTGDTNAALKPGQQKPLFQANPFLSHLLHSILKGTNPLPRFKLLSIFLRTSQSPLCNKPLSDFKLATLFGPEVLLKDPSAIKDLNSRVGKRRLLCESSELSTLGVYDSFRCDKNEFPLTSVIDKVLSVGGNGIGELISLLIVKGPTEIVVECVHLAIYGVAEKRLPTASLSWFRSFIQALLEVAKNPYWKGLCVEHQKDLCQLILKYLESQQTLAGSLTQGSANPAAAEYLEKLCLGLDFFSVILSREHGMFKSISKDTKYLFEDLPKESSMCDFIRTSNKAFVSGAHFWVCRNTQTLLPLDLRLKCWVSWLRLLDSMAESSVYQVILLAKYFGRSNLAKTRWCGLDYVKSDAFWVCGSFLKPKCKRKNTIDRRANTT